VHRGAGVAQQPLRFVERVVPRRLLEPAPANAPQRIDDAVPRAERREREAPLVAEPALVDLRVVPREDSLDLPLTRRHVDVAAHGAEPADRRNVLDLPRPSLEAVLRRGQRSDGTKLDHVAREAVAVRLLAERRDLRARAAIDRDELAVLRDALREARAPVAEDAALAVERDVGRDRDRLV
jgi:hypothetical protein